MKYLRYLLLVVVLVISLPVLSQKHTIRVNPDRTVRFTLYAPLAKQVKVVGTMFPLENAIKTPAGTFGKEGKKDMFHESTGVWTFTTDQLKSDYYLYNFIVDGVTITPSLAEPHAVRDISHNYYWFIVPGGDGDAYQEQPVAHGRLEKVWYPSSVNGMTQRRMTVYTPPAYSLNDGKRYPVLYLLHGSGGDENSWTDCGRAMQILDYCIATGRCAPMIVVMPNGNATLAAAPGEDPDHPDVTPASNNSSSMFGKIEKAFVPEVVNFVDQHYSTISEKRGRAIAGLSLGGLHTLFTSLNNPDTFDYIGLFSAQITNGLSDTSIGKLAVRWLGHVGRRWNAFVEKLPDPIENRVGKAVDNLTGGGTIIEELSMYEEFDEKLQRQLEALPALYYIAVGRDDFTYKLNERLLYKIASFDYPYVYNETDGGHTWDNWRRYLLDFLPRLFNY